MNMEMLKDPAVLDVSNQRNLKQWVARLSMSLHSPADVHANQNVSIQLGSFPGEFPGERHAPPKGQQAVLPFITKKAEGAKQNLIFYEAEAQNQGSPLLRAAFSKRDQRRDPRGDGKIWAGPCATCLFYYTPAFA